MSRVVMLRHGESEWNSSNLFCGWYNAGLSERGVNEAKNAGESLKNEPPFDIAFTSMLQRAQRTLSIILDTMGINPSDITIVKTWRLNERHYGGLTGMNKVETAEKYGEEQVAIWRRSFDVPPPPLEPSNKYYDTIVNDTMYTKETGPSKEEFPMFESLKMTAERTLPFWLENIVPMIKAGKRVLIVAHGNSLRGIIKHLDQISDEAISKLNLPTGIPFYYVLNEDMKPVGKEGSMQFIGDPETVRKAMEEVANQAKKKK